jgi:hypothetical protein
VQNRRRVSWTSDLAQALWFAGRLEDRGLEAHVYSATVAPDRVLAMFNERKESEDVVNTTGLRILTPA